MYRGDKIAKEYRERRATIKAAFDARGAETLKGLSDRELHALLGDKLIEMLPIEDRRLDEKSLPGDTEQWNRLDADAKVIGKEIYSRGRDWERH